MRKIRLRDLTSSTRDIGCGFLTVLFISLPVWVLTIGWRGPIFAMGALLVLLSMVLAVAFLSRLIERR